MNLAQALRGANVGIPHVDPPGRMSLSDQLRIGIVKIRSHERPAWLMNEKREERKGRTMTVRAQVLEVVRGLKRCTTNEIREALWSVDTQVLRNVVGQLAVEGQLKIVGKKARFLIYELG